MDSGNSTSLLFRVLDLQNTYMHFVRQNEIRCKEIRRSGITPIIHMYKAFSAGHSYKNNGKCRKSNVNTAWDHQLNCVS